MSEVPEERPSVFLENLELRSRLELHGCGLERSPITGGFSGPNKVPFIKRTSIQPIGLLSTVGIPGGVFDGSPLSPEVSHSEDTRSQAGGGSSGGDGELSLCVTAGASSGGRTGEQSLCFLGCGVVSVALAPVVAEVTEASGAATTGVSSTSLSDLMSMTTSFITGAAASSIPPRLLPK